MKKLCIILILLLFVGYFFPSTNMTGQATGTKDHNYESNQIKQGSWFGYNDSRFTFGLYWTSVRDFAFLAGASSDPETWSITIEQYEKMIETYLIPNNIYWIHIYPDYGYANTSTTKPQPDPRVDRLIRACGKYDIRVIMGFMDVAVKGTKWVESMANEWGSEFYEVDKNGIAEPLLVRFDYIDKWIWQIEEDMKHVRTFWNYSSTPALIGWCSLWEYQNFNFGGYYSSGYSNQTLANFTRTEYFSGVNSTGYYNDGKKSKLWEMFVAGSNSYNTTLLSSEIEIYQNGGFNSYKDYCFNVITNGFLEKFREYVNPNGIFIHDESDALYVDAEGLYNILFSYAGPEWHPTNWQSFKQDLMKRWKMLLGQSGAFYIMGINGHYTANNGGNNTVEDIAYQLYSGIHPIMQPVIWIMQELGSKTKQEILWNAIANFTSTLNKMTFISNLAGFEKQPLADVLLISDQGPYILPLIYMLGFNVTQATPFTVKNYDLTQFDTIIWWSNKHPDETNFETTNKIINAVNNTGVGLMLLGDAYCRNRAGDPLPAVGGSTVDFDGKLGELMKLKIQEGAPRIYHTDSNNWSFYNLSHPIWRPYYSFSLNDFIHSVSNGKHWCHAKTQGYDGTDLIKDTEGRLVGMARTSEGPGAGRVIWLGMYDTASENFENLNWYSKATSVLVNSILWTSKKDSLIPLIWFGSEQGYISDIAFNLWTKRDGKGLIIFTNNASTPQTIDIHFNTALINLGDDYVILDLSTMSASHRTETDLELSITIPPENWKVLYFTNQTNNIEALYTNMYIKGQSKSKDIAKFVMQGPYNQTGWLITNNAEKPPSVRTNVAVLQEYSSIKELDSKNVLTGWHYNSTENITYIKFHPKSITELIVGDFVNISLSILDNRINIGSNASVNWSGVYAYDNTPFTGSITLNDTTSKSTVGRHSFKVNNISGSKYGLSAFTSNEISCIWDRIKISENGATNTVTIIGQNETIWFKAIYEYDEMPLNASMGVLYVNGSAMTWSDENNRWEQLVTYSTVGVRTFKIWQVIDTKYSLTLYDDLGKAQQINWVKLKSIYIIFSRGGVDYSLPMSTNSTILNYAFNSTTMEMNFTVSGPTGTRGVLNLTLPKNLLMLQTPAIKGYIDGQPVNCKISTSQENIYVYIDYRHSLHEITLKFIPSEESPWLIVGIITLTTGLIGALSFTMKRKKTVDLTNF